MTWESTLQAYYAYQFTLHDLNLAFMEATSGPRFRRISRPRATSPRCQSKY